MTDTTTNTVMTDEDRQQLAALQAKQAAQLQEEAQAAREARSAALAPLAPVLGDGALEAILEALRDTVRAAPDMDCATRIQRLLTVLSIDGAALVAELGAAA